MKFIKFHSQYACVVLIFLLIIQQNSDKDLKNKAVQRQKKVNVNGVPIEMVYIPAGSFLMGSSEGEESRQENESPQHNIAINNDFWMGKYEVTQGQWKVVMDGNEAYFQEGDNYPVEWVSWDQVQEFIKKLNEKTGLRFRLPSEAEWEYACRTGTTTPFYFGSSLTADQANFNGNYPFGEASKGIYREKTTPVGSFKPNAWGLYDMHGNVWEWCEDVYRADIYANPELYSKNLSGNPVYIGQGSYRVFRGGGWIGNGVVCRSASRGGERQMYAFNFIGFRLVLNE